MNCPRCQQENPPQAKFCLECGTPSGQADRHDGPAASYTELQHSLNEALEQQTATSEILRVISNSPTDVQPVFDAIVESAGRLCGAESAAVYRFEAEMAYFAASYRFPPTTIEAYHRLFPCPLRDTDHLRRVVDGSVFNIPDIEKDPHTSSRVGDVYRARGVRSTVYVPMVREGRAIGAIGVFHHDLSAFSEERVGLLKTFADQAVIAIENVRLFKELDEKNRALTQAHGQVTETLAQQTATSEILGVIASSRTDLQPVFDAILQNAVRLCGALNGFIWRLEDGLRQQVSYAGVMSPEWEAIARGTQPGPPTSESVSGWVQMERRVLHVHDLQQEERFSRSREMARAMGYRSLLAVPLLTNEDPVGAIVLHKAEPFDDGQIQLLRTFADQAVIAIENVRLFTELQEKNRALTHAHAQVSEALERQTATTEILRVISRSPTEVDPVFDAILESAVRLCDGLFGAAYRFDGAQIRLVAHRQQTPQALEILKRAFPAPPDDTSMTGQAILTRMVCHIPDAEVEGVPSMTGALGRQLGFRSALSVPMLREGLPIGALAIARRERRPFSEKEIELIETFADQAVIAIENVRLFTELQDKNRELVQAHGKTMEALEQQMATSEILRVISASATDVQPVFDAIAASSARLCDALYSFVFRFDGETVTLVADHGAPGQHLDLVRGMYPAAPGRGGLAADAVLERRVITIADAQNDDEHPGLAERARASSYRSVVSVPMLRGDSAIGAINVVRSKAIPFTDKQIDLLKTFADQAVIAIENVRLFTELQASNRELANKSRQLEVASQHKSEFLANMSHELRTPLNAVIGFSEVLSERMFGDLNEKQDEYLKDIHASGQHLLSLINDILDLSKIEAGKMELELTDFHLPAALDNALTLVRERAGRHGIALHDAIDDRIEYIQADERKIKQVLLNLLSNAIKFTPEGGRIEVRAKSVNGSIEVSVSDTGVGIAPEDEEAIFQEFQQVGTAAKKVEGTGLGLALSRKFVELHGGKIWVKSQVGAGSTFTFTIPLRHDK